MNIPLIQVPNYELFLYKLSKYTFLICLSINSFLYFDVYFMNLYEYFLCTPPHI